jgi:hypothetical protein
MKEDPQAEGKVKKGKYMTHERKGKMYVANLGEMPHFLNFLLLTLGENCASTRLSG